jgi:hypothetical protein
VQFYNLRTKQSVEVPDTNIKKQALRRTAGNGKTQTGYQVVAEWDGMKLFKFVNEATYKSLTLPELAQPA